MSENVSEIAFSTANLPKDRYITMGPQELADTVHDMGYDNAEILPARWYMRSLKRGHYHDNLSIEARDVIGSVHQTFARTLGGAIIESIDRHSILSVGMWAAMPSMPHSLQEMRELQFIAGRPLLAVAMAAYQQKGRPMQYHTVPFEPVVTQLHPELFALWDEEDGVNFSLDQALAIRGLKGICWDRVHASRFFDPPSRRTPKGFLDEIAQRQIPVPEVHWSIGRLDVAHKLPPMLAAATQQELQATLRGPEAIAKCEIGDQMAAVFEAEVSRADNPEGKLPRVVVEVPASSLEFRNLDHFKALHHQLASNVRAFVQGLRSRLSP